MLGDRVGRVMSERKKMKSKTKTKTKKKKKKKKKKKINHSVVVFLRARKESEEKIFQPMSLLNKRTLRLIGNERTTNLRRMKNQCVDVYATLAYFL